MDTHPNLKPIENKFKSFGWDCDICDGHSEKMIKNKILKRNKKKPYALIAKTVKGNPVSFMNNVPLWHYRAPNKKELEDALIQIKKYEKRI